MVNLSGTLNAFRLLVKPSLCMPHATVSSFDQITFPVSDVLVASNGGQKPDIRALILDKDNCFAIPEENVVYPPYTRKFEEMREVHSSDGLLIVSNSAGTASDPGALQARLLEKSTGLPVLRHSVKKPGCARDAYEHLRGTTKLQITHASQIAVIGDRLFTDVMMANLLGCWSIWIKHGVVRNDGLLARMERGLPRLLSGMGFTPPHP